MGLVGWVIVVVFFGTGYARVGTLPPVYVEPSALGFGVWLPWGCAPGCDGSGRWPLNERGLFALVGELLLGFEEAAEAVEAAGFAEDYEAFG